MDEKDTKIVKNLRSLKNEVEVPRQLLKSVLERSAITMSKESRYEKPKVLVSSDWTALIFRTTLALAALVIFIGGVTEAGLRSDSFLGESVLILEAEASSIEYDMDEESLLSDEEAFGIETDFLDETLDNN